MMWQIGVAAVGLLLAGPAGALGGICLAIALPRLWPKRESTPPLRLVLILLLVEVRSGLSVLAALQSTARALPDYRSLNRVARLATVEGLAAATAVADPQLRPLVSQLVRTQVSGAAISGAIRSMLEQDLQAERAARLSAARSLPVRLMVPVTLLMLPGLVLMLYAPSLLALFSDLTGAWR